MRPLRTARPALARQPLCGEASEIFVDDFEAAHAPSPDDAVAGSHSVVLLDMLATPSECASLRQHAAAAAEWIARHKGPDGDGDEGRCRFPVCDIFNAEAQAMCDGILLRAIDRLRTHLPTLTPRLFGSTALTPSILRHPGLVFSDGEPAVNVYTAGGGFYPHTDKQALTVLVPLSAARDSTAEAESPESAAAHFVGGGTAFWCREVRAPRWAGEERGSDAARSDALPKVVIRPPAGTGIIFGGQLMHAAEPVVEGRRAVLVASFSTCVLRSRWSVAAEHLLGVWRWRLASARFSPRAKGVGHSAVHVRASGS